MFEHLLFYVYAGITVIAGAMVVFLRDPVRCALFLVLAFFTSCALWMMLEAEFLALVLVLVYVGAVMTLFLFVLMMMNPRLEAKHAKFIKYLPFGLILMALMCGLLIYSIGPNIFGLSHFAAPAHQGPNYSNVAELGSVLYTNYVYPFEIAGVLLLVAIISAITLAFRGKKNRLSQTPGHQVKVDSRSRVRLVDIKTQKRGQ